MFRWLMLCVLLCACASRTALPVSPPPQVRSAWMETRLSAAHLPPPTLLHPSSEASVAGVTGRIAWVRAESAAWNQWPDRSARLFNDRAAALFSVDLHGDGHRVQIVPERSWLEINVEGDPLPMARDQDELLTELLLQSLQSEQSGLRSDLAERYRAAGPFRRAWIPLRPGDRIQGLVGFPLWMHGQEGWVDRSEEHIVAMRIHLGIEVDGAPAALTWLLQ